MTARRCGGAAGSSVSIDPSGGEASADRRRGSLADGLAFDVRTGTAAGEEAFDANA